MMVLLLLFIREGDHKMAKRIHICLIITSNDYPILESFDIEDIENEEIGA